MALQPMSRAAGAVLGVVLTLAAPAGGQGPPGTDIVLVPLVHRSGGLALGDPVPVTRRPGYDNQPSFSPDGRSLYFTTIGGDGQADIHRYDLATRQVIPVIRTPESEYSATVMPDGRALSVVRVEADSTQRLWRFGLDDGAPPPAVLLPEIRPVGYHAWFDADHLLLFVLGAPATLQYATISTGRADTVARDVGRSLHRIPGRAALSFIQRDSAGSTIMAFEPATGRIVPIAPVLERSQDYAWMPDGGLLMGWQERLYLWSASARQWLPLGSVAPRGGITRLAVSPDGAWLAIVVSEGSR